VTTPGAIIDGVRISGDLVIAADNVVVRNSEIGGRVDDTGGAHGLRLLDSTIGSASSCVSGWAVAGSSYTAQGVSIRGHDNAYWMTGDSVAISDSYAKICLPTGQSSAAGIRANCSAACSGLSFIHNTVDGMGTGATAVYLTEPLLSTVTVTDNLFAGGDYTIEATWRSGPAWSFKDNRLVDATWEYGPATTDDTCGSQQWTGNAVVHIDSGYRVVSTIRAQPCVN
jgi:hypothetical protein